MNEIGIISVNWYIWNNEYLFAAQFNGVVSVNGSFSAAGGKSFRIDHPADPTNKYLYHYSIESPEVLTMYRGTTTIDADGFAWAQLPDYFQSINHTFAYQLTPIGAPMPALHIADEIADNRFRIAGGVPGKRVSWQVTATRDDIYIRNYGAPVEIEKPANERGTYLRPDFYGQPRAERRGESK